MSKRYVQVPISHLEPLFTKWKETFGNGHFVNVFFMPYGDILFRAMQFSDWMSESHGQVVRLINFETELIVNPESLEEILEKYKEENLILVAKRSFMRPDAVAMAGILEKWYAKEGRGALILHEGFPSELAKYIPKPVMTQAQLVHEIYSEEVAKEYLNVTAELFGVEASDAVFEEVVKYCGGIPWLLNDVLRRISDKDLFENETLKWKVEQIVGSIPNIPGVEKDLISYGLKNKSGEWLPIFKFYLDKIAKNNLKIEADLVIFDGRDLTGQFSAGERRILVRLFGVKEIVKREELGRQFWQENVDQEYSDWALDAIMSRLRKKVARLGLPIVINTRRGRGYEQV